MEKNKMTKKELLEKLADIPDNAIIHFGCFAYDDNNSRYAVYVKQVDITKYSEKSARITIVSEHPDNM